MKLSTALSMMGLALGVATFTLAQGCGGSDDGTSSGGTTSGKSRLPPEPSGEPTASSDERTFALSALFLGEDTRAGARDKNAWKDYGYNLDGLVTNVTDQKAPDLAKVCKRAELAEPKIHQDGNEGIDNSFGRNILELLSSFTTTPSKQVNDAVMAGDFTIMLKLKGLTDDPKQTNTGLSGTLLVGADYGDAKPAFDKTTDWPFRREPQVPITGAYITDGTFVNGTGGATVQLSLAVQGQTLTLTINKAIITFKHSSPGELTDGTIAGVVGTEELITSLGGVAGSFSPDLCEGSALEGIKDSIRQTSDMMKDGTQNPAASCDGISIGLGFTAKEIANPTKPPVENTPGADPCAATPPAGDAGADASQQ